MPERPSLQLTNSHSFSFQSLVIFFLSTIRSVSGVCLTLMQGYKNARDAIKKANQSGALFAASSQVETEPPKNTIPGSLSTPIPPSAPFSPLASPPPSPPLMSRLDSTISSIPTDSSIPPSSPPPPHPQANYVQPILQLATTLITPPTSPIVPTPTVPLALSHLLAILLTPFTAVLSRLLPYLLYTHVFSTDSLLNIVRSARNAMFPGGWPSVAPPDPTLEEQIEMKRELTRRLLALIPGPGLFVLGPTPSARLQAIDNMLDPLSSRECNVHLIVFILDLVLLTLFPEVGVSTRSGAPDLGSATPADSLDSVLGSLTPPRPDSRPP